ncbi:hypothetical protein [Streptomyces sp. CL12-4]|uniref:hypothetical protein n=1 Tax=Streptomyces sp. CL12-4 TaxID=2810306 RepID=UPI001EFB1B33|nr:hypothetical protein [Streptomyces sp. CL12-4]
MELWRTRHAITTPTGSGPRPADPPQDAAAWDDLDARIRALARRRRPLHSPPPDAPATLLIDAALAHLDTPPPSGPLPDHPALRDPFGVAPLSYGALDARLARRAQAAALAGEELPEPWMEEITAPGEDDEDEQRTYTRLLTVIGDYRRRHHRAGPDILGPRPAGLDAEGCDHLTDAIDLYTHARVARRLEQIRTRTETERAALLPSTSPLRRQPPSQAPRSGRPPAR